jgi:hypothetical protein
VIVSGLIDVFDGRVFVFLFVFQRNSKSRWHRFSEKIAVTDKISNNGSEKEQCRSLAEDKHIPN